MFIAVCSCGEEGTTLHLASASSSAEAAAPQIFMSRRQLGSAGLCCELGKSWSGVCLYAETRHVSSVDGSVGERWSIDFASPAPLRT
jgi:hypothetical protein